MSTLAKTDPVRIVTQLALDCVRLEDKRERVPLELMDIMYEYMVPLLPGLVQRDAPLLDAQHLLSIEWRHALREVYDFYVTSDTMTRQELIKYVGTVSSKGVPHAVQEQKAQQLLGKYGQPHWPTRQLMPFDGFVEMYSDAAHTNSEAFRSEMRIQAGLMSR